MRLLLEYHLQQVGTTLGHILQQGPETSRRNLDTVDFVHHDECAPDSDPDLGGWYHCRETACLNRLGGGRLREGVACLGMN